MNEKRRDLIKQVVGAGAVLGAPGGRLTGNGEGGVMAAVNPRIRIGVSTYSYWHFDKVKYPIEKVIENAGRLGFDGVEILHRQMESEDRKYVNNLKRMAFSLGLDLFFLSIHQNFVSPDSAKRKENIDHTKRCIDLAVQLGCPAIRLNSGRWGTIPDFQKMLDAGGKEEPLPGYTDEDAFKWCIDSINQCLPHAEQAGVVLALENHWGLTTQVDGLLKIYHGVNSPWLSINLDTGNFVGDPYSQLERLAPHAMVVQAKTYYGGGHYYTRDLDYTKIAGILRRANFKGYVSLEMEGREAADLAVPKSLELLRQALA